MGYMVTLIEANDLPSLEVEKTPIKEDDITDLLSEDDWRQVRSVLNWNLFIQKFVPRGPLYREHRNRKKVEAGRVPGQILYDELVTPEGIHYFDDLYQGALLERTKELLGIPDLIAAEKPDDGYVGNVLNDPKHRFPIHLDTKGTVSAVVMFPVDQKILVKSDGTNLSSNLPFNYRGGELIFSDNPDVWGLRHLIRHSIKTIAPDRKKIKGVFFTGDLVHGSTSIHPNSPSRYSIDRKSVV